MAKTKQATCGAKKPGGVLHAWGEPKESLSAGFYSTGGKGKNAKK